MVKFHSKFVLILHFLFLLISSAKAFALPNCQVLDKAGSRFDITLDLFGDVKKTKIDRIKAFLWIDPEKPEGAHLIASLEPKVSQLFGNFEENPFLIGMLANFLDNELIFKSLSVARHAGDDLYKIKGQVTSGKKSYAADFTISPEQLGRTQSRFSAKVQSDNFEKFLGTPGSAKGDFDLLFRTNPALTEERCSL